MTTPRGGVKRRRRRGERVATTQPFVPASTVEPATGFSFNLRARLRLQVRAAPPAKNTLWNRHENNFTDSSRALWIDRLLITLVSEGKCATRSSFYEAHPFYSSIRPACPKTGTQNLSWKAHSFYSQVTSAMYEGTKYKFSQSIINNNLLYEGSLHDSSINHTFNSSSSYFLQYKSSLMYDVCGVFRILGGSYRHDRRFFWFLTSS